MRYYGWQHSKMRLKARKRWFFQEADKLFQYSEAHTQNVDRSHILNLSKPSKITETDVVQATQETLKLIEDSWEAKWAHIADLETTQDRSTSDSAKALLQKQIDTRLALIRLALKDKEDWCSVNWFVALQAQLSLSLNFRRSLHLVRLRQWVCRRLGLQRHRQRPLCLCWLRPVRLLVRHLTAELINSWRHCWASECAHPTKTLNSNGILYAFTGRIWTDKILKTSSIRMFQQMKAVMQINKTANAQ